MKRKSIMKLALACICVLLLFGCSTQTNESGSSSSGGASEELPTIVIGESSPIASNPNQQAITEGQKKAAEKLGWKVETLDANLSSDKQITDIDTLISKKVDAITVWILNLGAADAAFKRATEAGIPIVGFNTNSDYAVTEIIQQTELSCVPEEEAAMYIKEKSPNAKVLMVGGAPVPTIQYRVNCFEQAAQSLGLEIVEKQDNLEDTAAGAQSLVENMLTKHPDVQAIWAYNDPSALGAAAVVQAQQRKDIMIFGINGSQEAIDAIKKGMITATWDTNSIDAGAAAISVLAMHYRDGVPISDLPKTLEIHTKMWDASNVDEYVPWSERPVTLTLPPTGGN